MGDNELGLFLRARREATTPAAVGLAAGPRRRAPGLRRAEVATLAGVSVEYLVRLEQGRWTAGYQRLAGPIGLLDGTPPSLARFVFTDERARRVFPDWAGVADEHVALLKQGPFRADPHVAALADDLALVAGDDFTGRVATVPGLATPTAYSG